MADPSSLRSITLSAAEAARALGISRESLYAYVSRGLIRSEAQAGSRARRYWAEDVRTLQRRREQRRNPGKVAEDALHWGAPVLESALTRIGEGRYEYRGLDALDLATRCSLEEVAALLWSGDLEAPLPELNLEQPPAWKRLRRLAAELPALEAFQVVLTHAGVHDPSAWDLAPESVKRTGLRILRLMTAVAAGQPISVKPVAEVLARGWAPNREDARQLLDSALVLWADHELNVSTFTVRCVTSAQSTPYAAVVAGLSALRGARHGGVSEQVEALFEEVGEPSRARRVCEARLRRGERLPGFGQPLYPDGDPRATILLRMLGEACPGSQEVELAERLAAVGHDLVGKRPNVDFGSTVLRRALGLPDGSGLALVAIGRVVGWIAHILEQIEDGRIIRPRARYVGRPPARSWREQRG